jgi:hypothetical protein
MAVIPRLRFGLQDHLKRPLPSPQKSELPPGQEALAHAADSRGRPHWRGRSNARSAKRLPPIRAAALNNLNVQRHLTFRCTLSVLRDEAFKTRHPNWGSTFRVVN